MMGRVKNMMGRATRAGPWGDPRPKSGALGARSSNSQKGAEATFEDIFPISLKVSKAAAIRGEPKCSNRFFVR